MSNALFIGSKRISEDIKNEIKKKMSDDYTKVTKVIRKIDDRDKKKEMVMKLLEAYIRKGFELRQASFKLRQLYKNRTLIGVFIPGFNTEARKYIFKNPDPYGYRLMAQNEELEDVTDFVWNMMSGENYDSMLERVNAEAKRMRVEGVVINTGEKALPSDCVKYWQVTGHLINMFAYRDNIDLTFFFTFDRNRKEIYRIGKRLDIPFKEGKPPTDRKKGDRRRGDQRRGDQRRGRRGGARDFERGDRFNRRDRRDRRDFQRRDDRRDDRDNNRRVDRRDNRRNDRRNNQRGVAFTEDSLTIFRKIEKVDSKGRTTVREELNTIIKSIVEELQKNGWKAKDRVGIDNYNKLVEKTDKTILNIKSNNVSVKKEGCVIDDYIGLTQEVDKFRDIFNGNLYYNKEDARKYFYSQSATTARKEFTSWDGMFTRAINACTSTRVQKKNRKGRVVILDNNAINNNTNDQSAGANKKNRAKNVIWTPEKRMKCANERIYPIVIESEALKINGVTCSLKDILKPDLFKEEIDSQKRKPIIREYVRNLITNFTIINNMYKNYKFESINFIETITKEELKTQLENITVYLIQYYNIFLKEYKIYMDRLGDEFGIESKELKALVNKVAPDYADVKKMKEEEKAAANVNVNRKNLKENETENKEGLNEGLRKKQEAINRITKLITKYKNDSEKVNKLKSLLNKARKMD